MQIVVDEPVDHVVILPSSGADVEKFQQYCDRYPDFRLEMSAEGEIIIMPPAEFEAGDENSEITTQLRTWAKQDGRGRALDSNAGYILPNSAIRAPDASWIALDRLRSVPRKVRRGFLPLCPDFVIELMSPSDRLKRTQAKMIEYLENGATLGWLIHEAKGTVYIYRVGREVEKLISPDTVTGEGPVEGFVLDLREIWAIRDSI